MGLGLFLSLVLSISALAAPASFEKRCDDYLETYYQASPSTATSLGIHQYDAKLEDFSRAANTRRIATLKKQLAIFDAIDAAKLSVAESVDRDLVRNQIRAELLERETVRRFETNPDLYSSAASNAVYVLMVRPFAP